MKQIFVTVVAVMAMVSGVVFSAPAQGGVAVPTWYDNLRPGNLPKLAADGCKQVIVYSVGGSNVPPPTPADPHDYDHFRNGEVKNYLEIANTYGIKVILSVQWFVQAGTEADMADIAVYANQFAAYPALSGWYVDDEPPANDTTRIANAKRAYGILKAATPTLPTYMAFMLFNGSSVEIQNIPSQYQEAYDVLMWDCYSLYRSNKSTPPVYYAEWTDMEDWRLSCLKMKTIAAGLGKPLLPVLQGYGDNPLGHNNYLRLASKAEAKFMVYHSVNNGGRAVCFWEYAWLLDSVATVAPNPYLGTGEQWRTDVGKPVMDEMTLYTAAIDSGPVTGAVSGLGSYINGKVYRDPSSGKYYLLTVNTNKYSRSVTLTIALPGGGSQLAEYGAGNLSVVGNTVSLSYTKYQVRNFELIPTTYPVTFDAQGGTTATPASTSVTYGAAYGPLATTARTGYAFAGWWTGADGTGTEVTAATTVMTTAAQTLYAKWTANSYTVTLDAAGGSVTPTSQMVTFAVTYGPLPSPTRTGYTFAGWWTGSEGAGTQVTESTVVTTAADHAVHAKWAGNQTITFPALPAKMYGDADFAPGATASSGLAVAYTGSNAAVAAIVDGKIHIVGAGTTMITAAQSGNDNWHAASPVTQTLIVAQKTVTATAENQTRSFGAANPAFSIAYAGFANGETAAVLDTPPTAVCSATATSGIGTYPITASGGSDNNYAFSYVAGTLTITPVVPTVTTTAPVAIGTTTATSSGTVTGGGGAAVTARGVCWSTSPNPTVANAKTTNGAGTGAFTSTLTGLSANTTYYVRAYATNSAGTGYGTPQLFATPVAKGADFVITGIILTPAMPAVGGKVTVTVTVLNQAILSGKAGYLYVWLDKPGTAAVGEKGDKSASVSTLKPGVSKTVKMSLTAPKTLGTFTLRAFIDAKNGVKEDDEYNNQETYVYDTGLPDFEILTVRLSPELPLTGKTFTAYVTVTNSGEVAGDAGYLDVWADSSILATAPVPGPKTKGNKNKTIRTLQPGQEKIITVTGLKAPVGTAWTLGLLIDSRAKTVELDETNNWFEFDYGASDTPPLPPPPPG